MKSPIALFLCLLLTANLAPQSVVAAVPTPTVLSTSVPDGTQVDLVLDETLSSGSAVVGQRVRFTVEHDVLVNENVVIKAGALALGTVTVASPKKWAGRAGKLEIAMQNVTAVDGTKIELTGMQGGHGDSHVGRMVTGIAITAIFTLGGSALFLLMHGKDINVPEGSKTIMFTAGLATVASPIAPPVMLPVFVVPSSATSPVPEPAASPALPLVPPPAL